MKNVIVFGASNSKRSINQQFAFYVADQLNDIKMTKIDLNDYEMPIYSIDKEEEGGIPVLAKEFNKLMLEADGFIVSFAEHNGAYSSAFKNIFDWVSRINGKIWNNKPVLFLATSPGARGGATVLDIAAGRMPYHGAIISGVFSLPSFNDNFVRGKIVNKELSQELENLIYKFQNEIN